MAAQDYSGREINPGWQEGLAASKGVSWDGQGRQQPPVLWEPTVAKAAPSSSEVCAGSPTAWAPDSLPGAAAGPASGLRLGRLMSRLCVTHLCSVEIPPCPADGPTQAPGSSRCAKGAGASCGMVRLGPPSPAVIPRGSGALHQ